MAKFIPSSGLFNTSGSLYLGAGVVIAANTASSVLSGLIVMARSTSGSNGLLGALRAQRHDELVAADPAYQRAGIGDLAQPPGHLGKQLVSIKTSDSPEEAKTWLKSELDAWRKITAEVKIELAE